MNKENFSILSALKNKASAFAKLKGSNLVPNLTADVYFYPVKSGTLVVTEANGLPKFTPKTVANPQIGPFGFHIHNGNKCEPTQGMDAFSLVGEHYNPEADIHPNHAGDLPVLFSNDGYCFMAVYTNRFTPKDVIGKTVIIHQSPDDFRTQPSGNSGIKIACGVIKQA